MGRDDTLSAGDDWPCHYRGFDLQISPNRTVWWQLYQGTDRLHLSPTPDELVDTFLELKPLGGRIHITEDGDVLTRMEEDEGEEYTGVYVGELDLDGELVPPENPEYSVDLRPDELSAGDLWPSVYDGSRYSFVGERVWWNNGQTHKRHKVDSEFPAGILDDLRRFKSTGGSFRITPWGDVITLVNTSPSPGNVAKQFAELPRVVQNIIKLRKERDVEMLPVYVGNIGGTTIEVKEPRSLTDSLSAEERESLSSWASSLGRTSTTSKQSHTATNDGDEEEGDEDEDEDVPRFDDDPLEWMEKDMNGPDSTEG